MIKKIIWTLVGIVALVVAAVLVCDAAVTRNASGRMYDDVDSVPHRKVGLVLGTSPISTWTGKRNLYFYYRMRAAADLYEQGKVDWLIVSGGDYRNQDGYNEPLSMRDSLVALGVDSTRIIMDGDGVRTLNSIANVKNVYGTDSIIIISQSYHNERALYQADHLGIDAIAFSAAVPKSGGTWIRNRGRECLARVKMFGDLLLGETPEVMDTAQYVFEVAPKPVVKDVVKQTAEDASDDAFTPKQYLTYDTVSTKHGKLICIVPNFKNVVMDMVCGVIPDANNDSIVMAFAGAYPAKANYTGHMKVAGIHVAGGKLYTGYRSISNGGAFTWSDASGPQFFYHDYSKALVRAAEEGGMGFGQEMLIHDGKERKIKRSLDRSCYYRALCLNKEGKLAIYESTKEQTLSDFRKALLDAGVTDALYTDMGYRWNYSFYRLQEGDEATFLFDKPHPDASNFIILKVR